jgi:glutaredoxin 3
MRRQMTERAQDANTLPQIFIGSKHIGGCDELYAPEDSDELYPLLRSEDRPA